MKAQPIAVEQTFDAPVEKVWSALTNLAEMRKWYFDLPDFKPEVGFEFEFKGGDENIEYLHRCRVVEARPNEKISYTWRYPDYSGDSTVGFELTPVKDKTKVTLTHKGVETFPKDDKNFSRESFTEGWNDLLGRSLKDYLRAKK